MGRTRRYDVLEQQTFVQLQTLPNVGPATAADFLRLGVASVDDLSRRDPKEMYERICRLDGQRHDPCVLDTYAAAVHAARTGEAIPWWEFSDRRKADEGRAARPRPVLTTRPRIARSPRKAAHLRAFRGIRGSVASAPARPASARLRRP